MDFLSEFWLFMRVRKKFWLMPIFFMVVTLGGLMVLLTKGSVKSKEWNLLKEEFDALVRNGFPLQGSPPVGWPGLPHLHHTPSLVPDAPDSSKATARRVSKKVSVSKVD